MISRRLTKIQKDEILKAYQVGENTNTLAEKYNCTPNTINRTVKIILSDIEYKSLKGKRFKSSNKKVKSVNNKRADFKQEEFEHSDLLGFTQGKNIEEEQPMNIDENFSSSEFEEIVPLISSFEFVEKELDFEIHNQEALPESVYMLVDKKVELEVKSISDLPEWSFLPENELKRNAILLFTNQRNAKRSCSRNQRVIKVPNTRIFEVSKPYLLLKGITRLILEDSMIALDN